MNSCVFIRIHDVLGFVPFTALTQFMMRRTSGQLKFLTTYLLTFTRSEETKLGHHLIEVKWKMCVKIEMVVLDCASVF